MVNLKDLRLGNWIKNSDSNIWIKEARNKPIEYSIDEIQDDVLRNPNHYDYIPLTAKILDKLGFKSDGKTSELRLKIGMTTFELLNNNVGWTVLLNQYDEDNKIKDSYIVHNDIKHVHQLQNLFYALTEVELMDVVAYNYFRSKLCDDNPTTFVEFMEMVNKVFSLPVKGYKIGDLPKEIFE